MPTNRDVKRSMEMCESTTPGSRPCSTNRQDETPLQASLRPEDVRPSTAQAVALVAGGLDGYLAVRVLQQQQVQVTALHVRMPCQREGGHLERMCDRLKVSLTVRNADEPFVEILRRPRFGYGRGMNPCLDCRVQLFAEARHYMDEVGADFVISGEVLGQRSWGQKRRDLAAIAHHSGLGGRLLRPLSAQLLAPSNPELDGLVDRDRLHAFRGQARRPLLELARELGFGECDLNETRAANCPFAEADLATRTRDLLDQATKITGWRVRLLRIGRHIRYDARTNLVVGRHASECETLERLHREANLREATLLRPANFPGPTALLVGEATDEAIAFALATITRYSKVPPYSEPRVHLRRAGSKTTRTACRSADLAETAQHQ
ncbi:MAG: hypothetical protein DWQ42_17710 [Planctomycetota bacterium]|nr:MAG: hypothetical protein DWQ42_17710 [Planctomycetota bacterium]REK44285.1 MAG: hypothetical protein DWQ46_10345 [Planctomycetota bacterium]